MIKKPVRLVFLLMALFLLGACSSGNAPAASPAVETGELVFQDEGGRVLYLGMNAQGLEETCGFVPDDGWRFTLQEQNAEVLALDGKAAFLLLKEGWTAAGAVQTGENISRATEAFGEPAVDRKPVPEDSPRYYQSEYTVNGHTLAAMSSGDGAILGWSVSSLSADDGEVVGLATYRQSGSGDYSYPHTGLKGYLDIACPTGAFELAVIDGGESRVLAEGEDGYTGAVLMPAQQADSCTVNIKASGEWSVVSRYPMAVLEQTEFSGSGDYVIGLLNDAAGKWSAEYSGGGTFCLIWHVNGISSTAQIELARLEAPGSLEFDISDTSTGLFEIRASGPWEISRTQ